MIKERIGATKERLANEGDQEMAKKSNPKLAKTQSLEFDPLAPGFGQSLYDWQWTNPILKTGSPEELADLIDRRRATLDRDVMRVQDYAAAFLGGDRPKYQAWLYSSAGNFCHVHEEIVLAARRKHFLETMAKSRDGSLCLQYGSAEKLKQFFIPNFLKQPSQSEIELQVSNLQDALIEHFNGRVRHSTWIVEAWNDKWENSPPEDFGMMASGMVHRWAECLGHVTGRALPNVTYQQFYNAKHILEKHSARTEEMNETLIKMLHALGIRGPA